MSRPLMSSVDMHGSEVIPELIRLFFPTASVLDPTYSQGGFWKKWRPEHLISSDIADGVDFRNLPHAAGAFGVVVFDPPFQPSTTPGIIGARFSKPVKGIAELKSLVQAGLHECWRVTSDGLIYKCQDYIHDHKPVWMSMWGWEVLGEPWDFVTARTPSKLIAGNWQRQLSIRRNHSTYWIWRKRGRR